jgi:DNA helicase II / ATP-dependent DNA helicase PcrA
VLLATRVVAFCLEPVLDVWTSLATGLELVAEVYRARGKVDLANRLMSNAADARLGRTRGNAKCPKSLKFVLEQLQQNTLDGNPVKDWLTIRRMLETSGAKELKIIAHLVIYLMGFNRGRRISDALAEAWQRHGKYEGARSLIEAAITEDMIVGSNGDLSGINVMTMHKSKGKEFDGVVILHLGNSISPLCPDSERPPQTKSRRLLRVGVTRAKQHVLMLTDVYSPSPLLKGHAL